MLDAGVSACVSGVLGSFRLLHSATRVRGPSSVRGKGREHIEYANRECDGWLLLEFGRLGVLAGFRPCRDVRSVWAINLRV
jgi:hypothetical protein